MIPDKINFDEAPEDLKQEELAAKASVNFTSVASAQTDAESQ